MSLYDDITQGLFEIERELQILPMRQDEAYRRLEDLQAKTRRLRYLVEEAREEVEDAEP